ncbi:hypothetical protein VTO73DRAFT_13060 [Trametes versicolor]
MSSSGSASHVRSDSSFVNATATAVAKPQVPRERTFVPKEKQLEKLRLLVCHSIVPYMPFTSISSHGHVALSAVFHISVTYHAPPLHPMD